MPQGRGRDRRDAGGLQADRGGDGRPGRSGRDRPHAEAGGVREGVSPFTPPSRGNPNDRRSTAPKAKAAGRCCATRCALSLITGQPFRIENIRGNRARPGADAPARHGDRGGLRDRRRRVRGARGRRVARSASRRARCVAGEHRFAVGTAGSTSLVLQTILPRADARRRAVAPGARGRHPQYARAAVRLHRPRASCRSSTAWDRRSRRGSIRHGFYPRGGGRIEVDDRARAQLARIDLLDRGARGAYQATRAGRRPARRDRRARARGGRKDARLERGCPRRSSSFPMRTGPGNIVMIEARFEHVTEMRQRLRQARRAGPVTSARTRRGAWPAISPRTRPRAPISPTSCCCRWRWPAADASRR